MRTLSRAAGALALMLAAATACSKDSGTARAATPAAAPAAAPMQPAHAVAAVPRLLFFMNPNGMPCQMQDRVLREMGPELAGKAEVVYVRTTESADIPIFERFGIRALPTLVLADTAGNELRRATPGIQPPEEIRRLLAP